MKISIAGVGLLAGDYTLLPIAGVRGWLDKRAERSGVPAPKQVVLELSEAIS